MFSASVGVQRLIAFGAVLTVALAACSPAGVGSAELESLDYEMGEILDWTVVDAVAEKRDLSVESRDRRGYECDGPTDGPRLEAVTHQAFLAGASDVGLVIDSIAANWRLQFGDLLIVLESVRSDHLIAELRGGPSFSNGLLMEVFVPVSGEGRVGIEIYSGCFRAD